MKPFSRSMRSKACFGVALAALGWAGATSARADDPAVRRAIEATHAQQARADTGGNAAQWRKVYQNVLAPGFTVTLPSGKKQSGEQFEEHELQELPLEKGAQEAFHIQRVTRSGNHATEDAFLTYRISFVDKKGQMGPKGKTHVVTGRNTFRAEWTKVGTSWKATDLHMLKNEEQEDGKGTGH